MAQPPTTWGGGGGGANYDELQICKESKQLIRNQSRKPIKMT